MDALFAEIRQGVALVHGEEEDTLLAFAQPDHAQRFQRQIQRFLQGIRIEVQDDDSVQAAAHGIQQDALRSNPQVDIHHAVFRPRAADHDIALRLFARMGQVLLRQRSPEFDERMYEMRLFRGNQAESQALRVHS